MDQTIQSWKALHDQIPRQLSDYTKLKQIGAGSFGSVFLGRSSPTLLCPARDVGT
jgi:hypothetical protein